MSPHQSKDESEISIVARIIRRRLWIVIVCLVASTAAAVLLTLRAEKEYSATTALLLRTSSEVEPQRAIETNLQLLGLPAVANSAAQSVAGLSGEEVSRAVEAEQQGESDIILVKATANEPNKAAEVANAFAAAFVSFRGNSNQAGQQTGRVEVVERATPSDSPVSPKPTRNIVFGALIGLVLGLGLALLVEQLDRRVKREDDLAEATGLPLLAAVPKRKSFDRNHLGREPLTPAETEVFRLLRANLRYFKVRQSVDSVLVTSAEPGEGKTLVALGLALAAVTSGEKVLLMEGDLRDPGLSKVLGLSATGGLSTLLSTPERRPLTDFVATLQASRLADAIGTAALDVVPAGAIPPNPTELVESPRMKEVIAEAAQLYDFVVIDTPPILMVSDAIPLTRSVDGVLAVSGLGVSTRSSAADLASQLERLGAPMLGLVANFAPDSGRGYQGYGYGRAPNLDLMSPVNAEGSLRSR